MLLPQLLTLCAAALPLAAATSPSAIHNLPAGWDNIARRAAPSPSRLTKRHGVGHVYPLPDGFPAPTSKQLQAIQDQALGALPGGALPTKLDKDSITSFQLVAFNELFEVAFFNSLLYNVTHNVKGYTDLRGETKAYVVETLKAVVAQEQLHALAANAVLKNVKAQTIEPSKEYNYGVESFDQAIALADIFTTVVLGTLQDIAGRFAHNAPDLVPLVASVIGQEGEQRGYYRRILKKYSPSSLPFGTFSTREFAYTLLKTFQVGLSDGAKKILLQTFSPLKVEFPPRPTVKGFNATVTFSFKPAGGRNRHKDTDYYVTYIHSLDLPYTVQARPYTAKHEGDQDTVWISADVPAAAYLLNGLTIAAVGTKPGPFKSYKEVTENVEYAPGIIYIDPIHV